MRPDALGISSPSDISKSHYGALGQGGLGCKCFLVKVQHEESRKLAFLLILPQACQEILGKPGQNSFILCNIDKPYKSSLQDRRAFTSPGDPVQALHLAASKIWSGELMWALMMKYQKLGS